MIANKKKINIFKKYLKSEENKILIELTDGFKQELQYFIKVKMGNILASFVYEFLDFNGLNNNEYPCLLKITNKKKYFQLSYIKKPN